MPQPLVSVLMPVYNAAATLPATLDSLFCQTLDDFEIIAVDDGSTDDSLALLQQAQQRDDRLRPIAAPHQGLIPALNNGLQHCRSTYVARMDADDLAHPQRLQQQLRLFEKEPDLSVVGCLVENFPPATVGEGFRIYLEWLNQLVHHDDICREIFIESPIVHPSALVRRAELLNLGGYQDRGWPEDYDLWLRYFSAGRRFAKVPQTLLAWREHPTRMTRTDSRYSVENFLRAKAHYLMAGPLQQCDALFIWGAGKTGRRLSKHLIRGGHPPHIFVDIAPDKIGKTLRNIAIIAPHQLMSHWQQFERPLLLAAVASRGARDLIRTELAKLGLAEGHHFICAA